MLKQMTEKFSEYTFDEIKIGQSKKFQITITESMVNDFAKISGDFSPIHMDETYAKSTTFNKRVVHGMLLASFLSRVDGMYLPGKHALYFSQNVEFRNPCFIGDELTIESKTPFEIYDTKLNMYIKNEIKIFKKYTNNNLYTNLWE